MRLLAITKFEQGVTTSCSCFTRRRIVLLIAVFFALLAVNLSQPVYSASYSNYYEIGKQAYNSGDYAKASRLLGIAAQKAPEHVRCQYYYALALLKLELFDQAQSQFERVIEIAPRSREASLSATGISAIQEYLLVKRGKISPANKSGYSGGKTEEQREKILSVGENYITNALDNGKVTRWNIDKMPIKLYIERATNLAGYQDYYYSSVKNAIDEWVNNIIGKMLKVTFVDSPEKADIKVFFAVKINLAAGKNYVAGIATPNTSQNKLISYEIKLATQKPSGSSLTENEMQATALHELGHALGIRGHSDKNTDVMYTETNAEAINKGLKLSQKDINTITLLYTLDADISNFDAGEIPVQNSAKNEKFLGSTDDRLNNELKQALEYTEKYPDNVLSWSKLGDVYFNLKSYDKALPCLQKAIKIDPSYTHAREKLAFTYKETGNFEQASAQFKKLVEIEPNNINFSHNYALYLAESKRYQESRLVIEMIIKKNPAAKDDSGIMKLLDFLDKN